jgi:UDPglucose 6-dehydrogenase
MEVVIVGCGYVGLVSGVGFASLGHNVLGLEIDERRANLIRSGIAPFHEPGLEEKLRASLNEGRFRVSSRIEDAVEGDVVFLCVQTPQGPDGNLNTEFIVEAARQVGIALSTNPRRRVVVVRSTVVPGTTEELVAPALAAAAHDVAVATNPEFLREGSAVSDFLEPDRVVIGCRDSWGADWVARLYAPLKPEVIRTTPAAAEMAKCTSNALLATLISFSNEVARVAEGIPGIDVEDVLDIIHKDRRLSPVVDDQRISPEILVYLKPGCGFGGSCLPKDLSALVHFASSIGEPTALLQAVMDINETQPDWVVSMTKDAVGELADRNVTVLGLAFKAGTDDLRESPGLKVVDLLLQESARVTAYDPLVGAEALAPLEERGVTIAAGLKEALRGAHACVIATRAAEFRKLGSVLQEIGDGHTRVIDGRRLLDPEGFDDKVFSAIGRSRTGFTGGAATAEPR